jgi:hypothetical protein
MTTRIEYRSGGNPPIAPGLFAMEVRSGRGVRSSSVVRLAWWPEGVDPSPSNIDAVVTALVWTRGGDERPITREQIRELFGRAPQSAVPLRGSYRRR